MINITDIVTDKTTSGLTCVRRAQARMHDRQCVPACVLCRECLHKAAAAHPRRQSVPCSMQLPAHT